MANAATYTKAGGKATTAAKLDKSVFGVTSTNHELLKQAYLMYLANGRDNLAVTKTRGQVSGGGKKPWRQKGTGRARFGSSRNPIWRSGGIAFGPTGAENYAKKLSLKAKRQALRQALSYSAAQGEIKVIEGFSAKDGKTANAAKLLSKIEASGNTLIVVADITSAVQQAVRNLGSVKLIQATYLNVFDVLNADTIVIEQPALAAISNWLGGAA